MKGQLALRRDPAHTIERRGEAATERVRADRAPSQRFAHWAAYAAAAWAVVFAAVSFYWAAGGTIAAHTVAAKPEALASPGDLWAIGAAKLVPALLALALARPWRRSGVRRGLRLAAWVLGGLLILYGAAGWADHALMAAGAIHTPEILGHAAVRWHLALWDPWWVLGGVLVLAAAWAARRESRL